jgi:hypothetical protein
MRFYHLLFFVLSSNVLIAQKNGVGLKLTAVNTNYIFASPLNINKQYWLPQYSLTFARDLRQDVTLTGEIAFGKVTYLSFIGLGKYDQTATFLSLPLYLTFKPFDSATWLGLDCGFQYDAYFYENITNYKQVSAINVIVGGSFAIVPKLLLGFRTAKSLSYEGTGRDYDVQLSINWVFSKW